MHSILQSLRVGLVAVVAATAPVASGFAAVITATIVNDPTAANLPFAVADLGASATPGFVSNANLTIAPGVTVQFQGDSGVYSGDVGGITRSPFRDALGGPTTQNYLNARADAGNGDRVVIRYDALQTSFNLLWGSVDIDPKDYNKLRFVFMGAGKTLTVTGRQLADAAGGGVIPGTSNLAVSITEIDPFDRVVVTASAEAFEFVPGVAAAVPEPGALALVGAGLLGLFLVRRRREPAVAAA